MGVLARRLDFLNKIFYPMSSKFGFGICRPSILIVLSSTIPFLTDIGMSPSRGSLLLNPMTYLVSLASGGAPNTILLTFEIVISLFLGNYVSIGMLVVAFLVSIPFSLWVMMSVIQGGEKEDLKPRLPFSLAVRELLQSPVYRLLNLFRFAPMFTASPTIWGFIFCDLSAVLAHTCIMKLGYQWIHAAAKGESLSSLEISVFIVLFAIGCTLMLIIESKARQIVRAKESETESEIEIGKEAPLEAPLEA